MLRTHRMSWAVAIETWISALSAQVPIPIYVFVGEVIEEIISPIPSQVILGTAGTMAFLQGWPIISLLLLALIGSFAKSITTMVFYILADILEDRLVPMFGKYIGITHQDIESIGKRFDKGGKREFVSLFFLRCLPVLPSAPLSIVCGLVKVNKATFFWSTVAGNWLRGLMILLAGYLGIDIFEAFKRGAVDERVLLAIGVVALLIGFMAWGYWQRYRGD